MHSRNQHASPNTSTPKRRRLGTQRFLRPFIQNFESENNTEDIQNNRQITSLVCSPEICESPPLPCNQIEYLRDSAIDSNNDSSTADVPEPPDTLQCSLFKSVDDRDTFVNSNTIINKHLKNEETSKEFLCEIKDDMFHTRWEQKSSQNDVNTSKCDNDFRANIEETFEEINHSICGIEVKKQNRSALFETRDSFLLDIKQTAVVEAMKPSGCQKVKSIQYCNQNTFYGLPMITKGLFKTYRNIEKFYDWQEECLNLEAINDRRNLIYALPTSGGKTLVAEVLMLREVLNRKRNALFILPYVALVQEKIWSLSPFALQLECLVEEYAAGKGHIPPKKRRKKNSIYIATIEKGLALVRSLIELNRLHEIGLIVVDELHLIGESGRGGTLETLLSTVIFVNQGIQIVGMSATIGNLPDIARFLQAEVFQRHFRPVELTEYVKLGDVLHKITWDHGFEVVPDRQLAYDYSSAATALDPDYLGGLVSEVVPHASCLVFCPTKRNCENVATLLCKLQRKEMTSHRRQERQALENALRAEGANKELVRSVQFGVAYHHAGLAADERSLLEHAFRSGVISVVCCTSTLAAGVNLPARRVIVRAPRVGRQFITLAAYRQMVGRAGRAGVCDIGESIIITGDRDWPQLRTVLGGGLSPARSVLLPSVDGLILSAVALKLAVNRSELRRLLDTTFLAVAVDDSSEVDTKTICDDSLRSLLQSGAVEVISKTSGADMSHTTSGNCYVYNDSELVVSRLGKAAIKGCMNLKTARELVQDLQTASKALVLMGSLHLLYIVTPHDAAGIRLDYSHYYSLYSNLDEEGTHTAEILGITEMDAVRMITGKPITNVPESVLRRFYLALMLRDLWKEVPFSTVADKYCLARGTVQSVMCSSAAFASCAQKFCEEMDHLWSFRVLFGELAVRLQHCAAPELHQLMELPAVKKARALQLLRSGYKRIEDIAKASADDLTSSVAHLSKTAANHLISAAKMMLIEKVENLRAEAEDVMEELNV